MAYVPTPEFLNLPRWKFGVLENFQRPISEVDSHAFADQPNTQLNEHLLYNCGIVPTEYEQNCGISDVVKGPFQRVVRGVGNSVPHQYYAATECSSLPGTQDVDPSKWGKQALLSGLELWIEDVLFNDYITPEQIAQPAQPSVLCAISAAALELASSFGVAGGIGYLFLDTALAGQLYGTATDYLRVVGDHLEDPFGNHVVITRSQDETEHKVYSVSGSFDIYVTDPHEIIGFEVDIRVNNTRRALWEQEFLIVPNTCSVASWVVEGPCN